MTFDRPDRPRLYVARNNQKTRRARLFWVLAVAAFVLLLATAGRAASKYLIKASHLGDRAVAVSCAEGSEPTTQKIAGALIVSCGN